MNEINVETKEQDDSIPGPIHPDDLVQIRFRELMNAIDAAKPKERGELARRYAIVKTDVEKAMAYHQIFVNQRDYWPLEG